MPEENQPGRRAGYRRILWLVLPAWLALGVEALGGWRFSKDMYSGRYAIPLGTLRDPVIWATLGAVLVSPILVVTGLVVAVRDRARRRGFPILLFLLTLSLVVSMFSCVWSCGGHPTWTSGYK